MINKIYRVILNRKSLLYPWLVILGFPMGYLVWNLPRYNGPAILRDEVGYLANAIFLAGYHIDGGSSYHIGFSLLLSPLFLFFSDVSIIWRGVMVINSLLWVVTFYFTDKLITKWDSQISLNRRVMVLLGVGVYPSWVTMSGYAFTTSAFVALFMIGLLSLINVIENDGRSVCFFTACAGFLYWIHPIGLMVSWASIIAIVIWAMQDRRRFTICLSHIIGCMTLVSIYEFVIHPFVLNSMTPDEYAPLTHYPSVLSILNKMKGGFFWVSLATHSLGQGAYFLIGSLGIALFGCCNLLRYITTRDKGTHDICRGIVGVYIVGALLLVILIGAVNFTLIEPEAQRSDQWIYGRYLDNVSIPIITIGILDFIGRSGRSRLMLIAPCLLILILTAYVIHVFHSYSPPVAYSEIVNIPSFWPQCVFREIRNVSLWLLIGASIIPLVYIVGAVCFYLLMPMIFIIGVVCQTRYHKDALEHRSAPTAIVDVIKDNYEPGSCIGFDLDSSKVGSFILEGRILLYRYYLYDYRYQRVSKEDWLADCSDLILTYDPSKYADSGIVIARETQYGLCLVKKKSNHTLWISRETPTHGIILRDEVGT